MNKSGTSLVVYLFIILSTRSVINARPTASDIAEEETFLEYPEDPSTLNEIAKYNTIVLNLKYEIESLLEQLKPQHDFARKRKMPNKSENFENSKRSAYRNMSKNFYSNLLRKLASAG